MNKLLKIGLGLIIAGFSLIMFSFFVFVLFILVGGLIL